jgi:hypothetical protein
VTPWSASDLTSLRSVSANSSLRPSFVSSSSSCSFGNQIDVILNHEEYGKGTIRNAIESLIEDRKKPVAEETREVADLICDHIRTLNSELERLNRLVRG